MQCNDRVRHNIEAPLQCYAFRGYAHGVFPTPQAPGEDTAAADQSLQEHQQGGAAVQQHAFQ